MLATVVWHILLIKNMLLMPHQYVRAYLMLQADLQHLFEFVEPADECLTAYSFRIHDLLMRTCTEVEANFRAILKENIYTPKINNFGQEVFNMSVYKIVNKTHHLSSYQVNLPIWSGGGRLMRPFRGWGSAEKGIDWYQAYNASKHDRRTEFRLANLGHLVEAVAGLIVLISSQFGTEDFSAGARLLAAMSDDYYDLEPTIGSLFRMQMPMDWTDVEKYDFDWSNIKESSDRFRRINYDEISP